MFLLDTNICIHLIKRQPKRLIEKLVASNLGDVAISAITLGELQLGVEKSEQIERNREALLKFVAPLEVLPFDTRGAQVYGRVRAELEMRGKSIGPLDTIIGAHALATGATLVTDNVREFRRIAGLTIENWLRSP